MSPGSVPEADTVPALIPGSDPGLFRAPTPAQTSHSVPALTPAQTPDSVPALNPGSGFGLLHALTSGSRSPLTYRLWR